MAKFLFVIIAAAFIAGCAGQSKELQMKDTEGGTKTVIFPNGTIFGSASKEQASTLAQIFVDAHNLAVNKLEDIKGMNKALLEGQDAIKKSIEQANRKTPEDNDKNLETAQKAFKMLELLSKRQGTGEVTIFYPAGKSQLNTGDLEHIRLVNFVDYLARESKGRKVLLVAVGSASAFGDKQFNQRLAQKRSEFPLDVIDKYLLNIPHSFYKVYATGDMYSPKNVPMNVHQRYQYTRIIAFYETDQIPSLPEERITQ